MTESHWLRRVLFLETVAGVPGVRSQLHGRYEALYRE